MLWSIGRVTVVRLALSVLWGSERDVKCQLGGKHVRSYQLHN